MPKNIQILVPGPCGENWDDMLPSGNGRFCGSCQKTVVDFTNMLDGEVLAWLADANKKVCGRFDADQLNRRLVPLPERKRKAWVIWQFVLAGLLISSKAPAQKVLTRRVDSNLTLRINTDNVGELRPMGLVHDRALPGQAPGVRITQCDKKTVGEPMMGKVLVNPDTSKADTPRYTNLPPVVVQGYATMKRSDIMGDVVTVSVRKKTKAVWQDLAKDTLAILGLAKKELTLYPNPVVRGAAIRYTLPSTLPGEGKLELFDSGGALLFLQQINNARTATLNIPASLPAGAYFVKLTPVGAGKMYTQKLVVL